MSVGPSHRSAGQARAATGGRRSGHPGACGLRGRLRRHAILTTLLLLAAGLFGGLVAGAPSAAAGGPPDDPGSHGQDQGKGDEKRPDHAGQEGGKDGRSKPADSSGDDEDDDGGQDGRSSDERAEDEEPSTEDQTEPDSSEGPVSEEAQGDGPALEEPTTQDTDEGETLEGHAPLVAPLVDPAVPEAGQLVRLDASAWDPDGRVVAVDWFLPDGTWLTGSQVSHVFVLPGNHSLEVVATDDQGYTTTATVDIQVLASTTRASTGETLPTTDADVGSTWESGLGEGEALRSNALDQPSTAPDPLTGSSPAAEPSSADRPLGAMAAVAAFLVGAVALVARAE